LLRRGLARQEPSPVTPSFVAVAAASAVVVALFNVDLPNAPHTLHGILHGLGGLFFWTRFPWRQSTCPPGSVSARQREPSGDCR
jgi:hypothetical protein